MIFIPYGQNIWMYVIPCKLQLLFYLQVVIVFLALEFRPAGIILAKFRTWLSIYSISM
jgi:hypothetical protein